MYTEPFATVVARRSWVSNAPMANSTEPATVSHAKPTIASTQNTIWKVVISRAETEMSVLSNAETDHQEWDEYRAKNGSMGDTYTVGMRQRWLRTQWLPQQKQARLPAQQSNHFGQQVAAGR
jgi:hypothetical protein